MSFSNQAKQQEQTIALENQLLRDWLEISKITGTTSYEDWWEQRVSEICSIIYAKAFCILDCNISSIICEHLNGWYEDKAFNAHQLLDTLKIDKTHGNFSLENIEFDQFLELKKDLFYNNQLIQLGMTHVLVKKIDEDRVTMLGFSFKESTPSYQGLKLIETFSQVYHLILTHHIKNQEFEERFLGIRCLHHLSSLGEDHLLKIEEFLSEVVDIIPNGFLLSLETQATITFENKSYQSNAIKIGEFTAQSVFNSDYLDNLVITIARKKPFLKEELYFLDTLTKSIGHRLIKKRSVTALQQNEWRLKNLLSSQTNYVLRTNLEGKHTYWNSTFEETFGWIYEGIPFENHHALTSIADYHHQRTLDTVMKCIESPNRIFQVELDKPKTNGGMRTTLWEFVCLLDEKGQPYEIQCMGIDISKRKKAELELAYSELKYRFLFDHSPNGVLLMKDGRFIECNLAAVKMIGGKSDDILGKTPLELSPEYQPDGKKSSHFEKEIINATNSIENQYFEWTHKKVDNSPLIVEVFTSKLSIQDDDFIFVVWDDITEKKASEEKLRKLSMAVEQNPLSIVITNLEGNIEYANSSTFHVTGYEAHELLGKNPRILKSGLTPSEEHIKLWNNITNGELWQGRLHNRKKNGELYTEKATIGPIKDEKGKITHYIAIKEDITEKIATEKNLELSEERFRQIAEQSQTVIWEVDLNGLYTYISPVAVKVFGYKPEELIGKKYFYDMHPQELQPIFKEEALSLVSKQLEIRDFENPILRKDGEIIWVSTNATPMVDQNQHIVGYRGSDSDITERKIAKEQLKEQNDRLNAIISANPDLIFIIDHHEKIQSFYASNDSDLLLPAEQIIGTSLLDIFGKEERMIHSVPMRECLESKKKVTYEYQLEFNNKIEYYESRMVPLSNQRVLAFVRNISDRVKAEQGLIELNMLLEERVIERTQELEVARKEAESANLAKSEFLSRMSHELRTPMNSILGFAQLMEMGELTEKQTKSISQILKSGRHLLDLINEILDISKIDAGKISISLEPVQIRPILTEMMEAVSPLAMKNEIDLEFIECQEIDYYIFADKQRLKQILLNLISNAIKYNHPKGKVWIGCRKLIDKNNEERVQIYIRDNGFGIDSKHFERIFNPFERILSVNSDIEGTGLGLAVVKKLTDVMNGNICIESIVNEGSTFSVDFKRVSHEMILNLGLINNQELNQFVKNSTRSTILYVEDNSANLELVEHILQTTRPSAKLISTIYGKQALQLVKEYKPNLVLLDLNLPDIHGSEVITLLKADQSTRDIPVIIVSADAIKDQIQRLLDLGAEAYLTKPIEIKSFLSAIDNCLKS